MIILKLIFIISYDSVEKASVVKLVLFNYHRNIVSKCQKISFETFKGLQIRAFSCNSYEILSLIIVGVNK